MNSFNVHPPKMHLAIAPFLREVEASSDEFACRFA
jgi:hypothetical protein